MVSIHQLVVFDCLKVHELKVEPRKVTATYTLIKDKNHIVSNTLYYTYKEKFFQKTEAQSINLASMMVAQVAVNYGLFCKKIVFDGLYDQADIQFLEDMTENTAREIYVNKFLLPNEFLLPPFDQMHAEKRDKYSQASLIFQNSLYEQFKSPSDQLNPDSNKFAILSSGGKDSLLSYGLLNELYEAHPVYINESGRHWFTAYNAYHYMKKFETNTVKPWCNSDRIFNWMVRQMPFIKPNFLSIRADIYPIRLWTVAVFLFGVLPVALKRNIRNIVIGNEYDTTLTEVYKGINHYSGLYDQSKFFDNALSKYYRKKGWNMYQFSMLRSLGELLILKILVKRYPELQRHQVSCHASHKVGDRMVPCGNCEKCRRIVGMLKALDEDPMRCGYSEKNIQNCLKALEKRNIKQHGADAQYLFYLLLKKELIEKNDFTTKKAKVNPEIVSLRFDNERSMLRDLPLDIRKPIYDMLRSYAEGIVKIKDRRWVDYPSLFDDLSTPYILNKPEYEKRK